MQRNLNRLLVLAKMLRMKARTDLPEEFSSPLQIPFLFIWFFLSNVFPLQEKKTTGEYILK